MRGRKSRELIQAAELGAELPDVVDDISDKICATLAAAITQGALKPGEKILEDAIAAHFHVSRTVVRGALAILQRDHLLERKRNRGAFVVEPSIAEAQALFEARRTLEDAILAMVAPRAREEQFARLEALIDEEERVHGGHDAQAITSLWGRFHVELAALGENPVMTELLDKVIARMSLVMTLYGVASHNDCGSSHHRQIVQAIRRKDLLRAQALMREHLADIEFAGSPNSKSRRPAYVRVCLAKLFGARRRAALAPQRTPQSAGPQRRNGDLHASKNAVVPAGPSSGCRVAPSVEHCASVRLWLTAKSD